MLPLLAALRSKGVTPLHPSSGGSNSLRAPSGIHRSPPTDSAIVNAAEINQKKPVSSEPAVEKPRSLTAAWVALALLFAVLGGFIWKSGSDRAACILNTRNVQQAARSFHGMNGLNFGDRLAKADLVGPGKFIESEPAHPAIGTLAIRCSHRKHQLDPALIKDW